MPCSKAGRLKMEWAMNHKIKADEAREALREIKEVEARAEDRKNAECASFMLMLWGLIWFFLHIFSYADFRLFGLPFNKVFLVMVYAGMLFSFIFIFLKTRHQTPTRTKGSWLVRHRETLLTVVWTLFFFATMPLLRFEHGQQANAYYTLYWLLLSIVLGMWFPNRLLLSLGVWVSLGTLIGCYFFLGVYYSLWMGFVVGGSFFGSGLRVRLKCRNTKAGNERG